ncbi:MAG: J domain-containing protein [Gammaproteobacteria bacterium]
MKTPYQLLNVAVDAGDTEIKQAYLQQVKEHPPEHDAERFQAIHSAYQTIKDAKCRTAYDLFVMPAADFDELLDKALNTTQPVTLDSKRFEQLLRAGSDDQILQNALPNSDRT